MPLKPAIPAAVLILLAVPVAAQDSGYMFDVKETSVDPTDAKILGSRLLQFAQTYAAASPEYYYVGDYRKVVRVAFQLTPDDAGVAAAHARIRAAEVPEAPKKKAGKDDVMPVLIKALTAAREGSGRDDRLVAAFLASVGLSVDSSNELCLVESQKPGLNLDMLWEQALNIYRRTIPDGTVCIVKALALVGSGMTQVGQVSRMVLTYRTRGFPTLEVRLLREQGMMMNVAADEATRYWNRVRRSQSLPNGAIEISFEDKFTAKEGPSAGAAQAVLLRSFSDPFTIDPNVAMTGDVSVEGRILRVGGIYPKIRGALLGKCARVGVPAANETDLVDAVVLNGWTTLAEIEVLGLETVDDAVAMIRTDRDEKSKKTSEDFAALRALVEQKSRSAPDAALNESIQKKADAILAANPRHLSAQLISLWNRGKLPGTLTLSNSLGAVHDVLVSYLVVIRRGEMLSFNDIHNEARTTNISTAMDRLKAVLPKMHLDAKKPAEKLEQCCASIQRYVYLRSDLERKQKKIEDMKKPIREMQDRIDRARAEKRPADEINALVKKHNQLVTEQREAQNEVNRDAEERAKFFVKAIDHYNDFIMQVRTLVQDPKFLEKLHHGR